MGYMGRLAFASGTTVAVGIATILYFRMGVQLIGMGQGEYSGPFTPVVDALEFLVPLCLALILLGVWTWVVYGGVQRERTKRTQVYRR